MRFLGVDLAAQPLNTAWCEIAVGEGVLELVRCEANISDSRIIEAANAATVTAIDAPFGFPLAFEEAMDEYLRSGRWPDLPGSSATDSRIDSAALRTRETENFDSPALSSSSSLLTVTTWRCLRILSTLAGKSDLGELRNSKRARDEMSAPCMVEVYPAESIRRWAPNADGKGKNATSRARLARQIAGETGPVRDFIDAHEKAIVASDHKFDAFIACLTAIAFHEDKDLEDASELNLREGWIYSPPAPIAKMVHPLLSPPN